MILKLVLLTALLFLTAPTATHAIAKAARLDRYTNINVDGDPGTSRIAQIVVAGDRSDQLEENPDQVLDVHEDDKPPDGDAEQAEADEPEAKADATDEPDSDEPEADDAQDASPDDESDASEDEEEPA